MTAICGVIGEWSRVPHAAAHLDEMLRVLVGAGPGGSAVWSDPERGCRIGVAGRCWSPYAPRVLRDDDLIAVCDGHAFACASEGDEQLLRVWANAGPRGLAVIDSQFAIAVWDQRAQRLTLARDALGVRSLYYHQGRGGLVFASTIEALLAHPAVPLELDLRSISSFLTVLAVPPPHTLFAEIGKLPPGTFAVCASDGVERIERFWSLFDDPPPAVGELADYAEHARTLHREAVEARLVDGALGALVGSTDGCRNVIVMSELGVRELHTFAVALAPGDLAEGRRAAEHAGAIHHDRVIDEGHVIEALPYVIEAQDDLVSEPWSVLHHPALEMVRDERLHVVITGEANLSSLERVAARMGIEARCPYAAPAYAHFVQNSRFKPPRDNRPFPDLFRGPFGDWAEPHLLDGGLTELGVLRRDVLTSLLAAHRRGSHDLSMRLWTALVLNLWYERWVKRPTHERVTAIPRGGRDSQRAIARARDIDPPTDDRPA